MARLRRDAFLGGHLWQDFVVMRSRAAIRGNFFTPCIPKGASDGKSAPSWQHIAAVYPKQAGVGKICAPCIRKALQIAFWECTARRSCQGGALFAARTPRIMHTAQILPSVVDEQREPPAPTAPPSWRGAQILPSDVDEPPWRSQPLCRRTARAARNRYAEAQLESQRHGLAALC